MTRTRTGLATALLIPLFAAACEQGPTAPPEEAAQLAAPSFLRNGISQRFDIAGSLLNRCTGETILVTGEITRVANVHEDQGGGYHWFQNYSIHATAIGPTGTEYIYNEIHNMKENGDLPFDALFDDTGAYYFTMSFISTLISKGTDPNLILQWDIRFKMDRDGNVTMDELRREFVCRG